MRQPRCGGECIEACDRTGWNQDLASATLRDIHQPLQHRAVAEGAG
jgi:hypothetical protein